MAVSTRTVREDLSVRLGGCTFVPKRRFDADLMRGWVGEKVQVAENNFWGTELRCAVRLPCNDVMQEATLRIGDAAYLREQEKERG